MNLSPFLSWLLYSSATASVLVLIILLVKKLCKSKLGIKGHYFIWFLLMIKLLAPYSPESHASIFNVFQTADQHLRISDSIHMDETPLYNESYDDVGIQPQDSVKSTQSLMPADVNVPSTEGFKSPAHISVNDFILYIWVFGALVYAASTLYRDISFYFRIKKCSASKDEVLKQIISDSKAKIGIHTEIVPVLTDAITFPSIYGFVNPKLLIPPSVSESLSEEELKYIILHELSHVKRGDVAVNCLAIALKTIHWFNPIIRYAFYRMKYDMEVSCDALALSFVNQNEYQAYGQTMIDLLKSIGKRPAKISNAAGILSKKSQVRGRVMMIRYFKKNSYRWSAIALAIVLIVGVTGLTAPISAKTGGNSAMEAVKGSPIAFSDPKLSESIAIANFIPSNSTIYEGDAKHLKALTIVRVENLQGIEYCSSLEELSAVNCSFQDLRPLTKLKNLKVLNLQLVNPDAVNIDLMPLKQLENLEVLNINAGSVNGLGSIDNLNVITSLKKLKSLGLGSAVRIDPEVISGLQQLETLDLNDCQIADASSIADLQNLELLHLDSCNLKDLSFLQNLKKLKELSIMENSLTDISVLSGLTGLEILNIDDNKISDIDALSKMHQLKDLEISRNTLTDLKPLEGLESLEVLVASADHISDLSPLSSMKKLRHLELVHNEIRDISPISGLPIETLVLSSNQADITPLERMNSLKSLYLDNNGITDLSPLKLLTGLEFLSLEDNKISDLAPISGLTGLSGLDLMNNDITDIKPLAGMKNLDILHLKGNPIKDYGPIAPFRDIIQYKDF